MLLLPSRFATLDVVHNKELLYSFPGSFTQISLVVTHLGKNYVGVEMNVVVSSLQLN